jgi:hypothetical protein
LYVNEIFNFNFYDESSCVSSKPLKYCNKSGYNLFQQLCTVDSLISAHESPIFMLSGFHHVADENCAHLGYYAVSSGSYRCFGTSYQHHLQGLILEDGTNRMS